jgi:predicted HTH transcriptional regulator
MITSLTIDEILQFLKNIPEQAVFDWKQDFVLPSDDEKKGELVKDIAAVANASVLSYGFIFYGVNPKKPDPLIGITSHYDDANIQQLIKGKIEPLPSFLYYEVSMGAKTIAVIQIKPSKKRPFIISADIGRVRRGQIVIRRGSSTDGATLHDLFEFFYGNNSTYAENFLNQHNVHARQLEAQTAYMAQSQAHIEKLEDDIWRAAGFSSKLK